MRIRKLVTAITVGALTMGSGAAQAFAQTSGGPVHVRVNQGESLWQIAQRSRVSLADMIRSNNMLNPDRILAGANLYLPYPVSPKTEQYTAQRGDTPATIAARFGTSLNSIYSLNVRLKPGAPLMAGQSLQVSRGPEAICPEGQPCLQTYAVMPGDTLGSIAWTARVSVADLVRVNNLKDSEWLSVGQTLIIPRGEKAPAPAPIEAPIGWTNEQGDSGRSGYNPTATLGNQAKSLWNSPVKVGQWGNASGPILGNGLLFIGSTDQHLYALNPDTGAVVWKTQLDGENGVSMPAYDPVHNLVFATTNGFDPDGHVYAVDAKTGQIKWHGRTAGQWSARDASPVVEGNRLFVVASGSGDTLCAFDVVTGQRLWTASGGLGDTPAVAGGKVFTNYVSTKLTAYRTSDGAPLWSVGGGWSSGNRYNAMAVGNRVFAISNEYDTWVVANDAETGKELWRRADHRIMASIPMASDGSLVWVTIKGGVMALDSATGAVKREVKLADRENYAGAPVIGKTHLYVPMGGKIWAVDRQTGAATELAAGQGPLALVGTRLYFLTIQDEQSGQAAPAALEGVAK